MQELKHVSKSPARVDSLEKVTGKAKYTADFMVPGMLYAKVLRSPYPHARIRSIDTTKAEKMPGVRGVVKPEDAPDYRWGFTVCLHDQLVLPRDGVVRYVGEEVAIVVADSAEIAEEALDSIEVNYEELPAVFDAEKAMRKDPPAIVHPDLSSYVPGEEYYPYKSEPDLPNVAARYPVRVGDVDKAFEEADQVVESRFTFDRATHCAIEPHIADAWLESDGTLTVRIATQGIWPHHGFLCEVFSLPPSKVRVISPYVGGTFGGKSWGTPPLFLVALAALKLKSEKPIRLEYAREEVFLATGHRLGMVCYVKDGAKKDGTIIARDMKLIWDLGAYQSGSGIMPRTCLEPHMVTYKIPNFRVDSYGVYTNNPPTRTMRAVESPQLNWAMEQQLDIVAHKLGLDPIEVRRKNLVSEGDTCIHGEVLHHVYPIECLNKVAEWIDWGSKPESEGTWKRGKGIAVTGYVACWGVPSSAAVKILTDGVIEARHGEDELGQGLNTVVAQIAAEQFRVSLDRVKVVRGDTLYSPRGEASYGTRSTFHTGSALIRACQDAKQQLFNLAAPRLGVSPADLETADGKIYYKPAPEKAILITELFTPEGSIPGVGEILGRGEYNYYVPPVNPETGQIARPGVAYPYFAYAVEVVVNVETGEVKVLRFGASYDAGQPINPKMCEAQIEGGMGMGIGTTIYEQIALERGIVVNPTFIDYKIPTAAEVPCGENVKIIAVVHPHPEGPYGAKGLGEPVLIAVAAAVCNAVYDATGARMYEAPITRERVLTALKGAKKA